MKSGSTSKWLLTYAILLGVLIFFNVLPCFKSGPCTPNFDILSIVVVGLITAILMVRGIIKYFSKEIRGKIVMINVIAFAAWCFAMFV